MRATLLVLYFLCNQLKSKTFGGLLLFFYLQIYLGFIFDILYLVLSDERELASSSLAFAVAIYIVVEAIIVALASLLLIHRYRTVFHLRLLGYSLLVLSLSTIPQLYLHLSNSTRWPTISDCLVILSSLLWYFYLMRSERVRMVFVQRSWNHEQFSPDLLGQYYSVNNFRGTKNDK